MKTIGVLGAGTMGSGIIQSLATIGFNVVYRARRQSSIDNGRKVVEKRLELQVGKGRLTAESKNEIMSRIKGSTDINIIREADLIIEAITENIDDKKALFKELDEICKKDVIIATNTSTLSITNIASATNRQDKVIGMHFFNPAPLMPLVEVITGINTSADTKDIIVNLAKKLDKTPVLVKDSPGFIVNRMLIPMANEAVGILADGICSAEDIDEAMKLGASHKIGPLALLDLIGLDVSLAIMEILFEEFGDPKYRPHPLLRRMVRAGKLGRKTGGGFFDYNN